MTLIHIFRPIFLAKVIQYNSLKNLKRNLSISIQHLAHSPDYYAVLGLNKSADKDKVKLAYFKRAKKYHPDSNPSDEAR